MTVILGLRMDGRSYLASDTAIVHNGSRLTVNQDKTFEWGGFVIGASGDARLLTYAHTLAESQIRPSDGGSVYYVIEFLRDFLLTRDGWKLRDGEGPPTTGSGLIVASPAGVWHVCSSWAITSADEGVPIGTGSGCEYAEGATLAYLRTGMEPGEALTRAVVIATEYQIGCGGHAVLRRL